MIFPFPPPPTGLHVDEHGNGTYAVAAPRAERIELCIFHNGTEERIPLTHVDSGIHWARVSGFQPGTHYGLRAYGPWDVGKGLVFNPSHVLLDPYAVGIEHAHGPVASLFAHRVDSTLRPLEPKRRDERDNRDSAPHSVVVNPARFETVGHRGPRTELRDAIIYEAHVKGFSALNPLVPEELRGTYAGMAHPASIGHLKSLGINTVELLPIHAHLDEVHLTRLGLTNYWGYNSLSFFAPHPDYASKSAQDQGADAVFREVQEMVSSLHEAGISVILDVVFNHSAEGDADGPSLSLRGLDPLEYYWHEDGKLVDVTGTGNSLAFHSPHVIDMVLRSLRFWVEYGGIDGFRFDLAATLGRSRGGFNPQHPLLQAILLDPVLRERLMIAEPWDVGSGGWQTGNFPAGFLEWNDSFRDNIRDFWLQGARERDTGLASHAHIRDLATRLTGSADIFRRNEPAGLPAGRALRSPLASVNFVTAHDGFTLRDLTTYDRKHNLANGENGRDGTDSNRSYNHGAEGEHSELEATRDLAARNLVATLLLSAGTPMLTAGDEFLRTQDGNNNAYCQDNAVSWVAWDGGHRSQTHMEFTRQLIHVRSHVAALRPTQFFEPLAGFLAADCAKPTVGWYRANGCELLHEDWFDTERRHLTALYRHREGDALLFMSNEAEPMRFVVPIETASAWEMVLDSTFEARFDAGTRTVNIPGPGIVVLAPQGLVPARAH